VCSTHNAPATQNACTNSRSHHKYDYVRFTSSSSAPPLSENGGVAITFNHHRYFKRSSDRVGERHAVPSPQVRRPNGAAWTNKSRDSNAACDKRLSYPLLSSKGCRELTNLENGPGGRCIVYRRRPT